MRALHRLRRSALWGGTGTAPGRLLRPGPGVRPAPRPYPQRLRPALLLLPLWLLSSLATTQPALAHRGHAVWTDITWAGDRFEIMHRMHLADAITVSRFLGSERPIDDLRSLAGLALYVEQRFRFAQPQTTALSTVGAEIEDDFLLVYQEWQTPLPARFPAIENELLLDVEPQAQAFIRILAPGIEEERMR